MRYALTIGVNDYAGAGDLAGCVNDARDVALVAQTRGYQATTLLDGQATREGILDALVAHVARLRYQDRLLVAFSGHGTKVYDRNGDEGDGWDEAWVASDMQAITDDDLGAIFDARAYGSRCVLWSDSCFAGTVTRVGSLNGPAAASFDPKRPRRIRALPAAIVSGTGLARDRAFSATPTRAITTAADVLTISAASPTEYAYDGWFQVQGQWRPNGAFTYHALRVLAAASSWRDLVRTTPLPSGDYPQTPELDGTYRQSRWPCLD
jgi:hypothetical protein